jgi:uncharacterized membrane protein YkvA (DUF1232 family)
MAEFAHTAVLVGGSLVGLFMILLALPQSKFRDFLMPIIGWSFALFCGGYILFPGDLLPEVILGPFGLIDDAGALVAGVCAARAAMKSGKAGRQLT